MSIKQIFLTLILLFTVNAVATSQVKKQYQDEVHKSTTIVIKEEGANDLDILNSQFNLDDYKVNEQIKITTEPITKVAGRSNNVSGGQPVSPPAPDLTNATASAEPTNERPKRQMKRWSVRPEKTAATTENRVSEKVEEMVISEKKEEIKKSSDSRSSVKKTKKSTSNKYRKKSKKVRKKKRSRKLKNRKRKARRNKKLGCYKF